MLGRAQQHNSLPRRLRRRAVLRVAGAVRRELSEPVLLRGAEFQLHTVDDADLQRWTGAGGDAQDCWHGHVHTRRSPDSVRPHSGFQRMCKVKHVGRNERRTNVSEGPPRTIAPAEPAPRVPGVQAASRRVSNGGRPPDRAAAVVRAGTNIVLIQPEVAEAFPTEQAVNEALLGMLNTTRTVRMIGGLPNRALQPTSRAKQTARSKASARAARG